MYEHVVRSCRKGGFNDIELTTNGDLMGTSSRNGEYRYIGGFYSKPCLMAGGYPTFVVICPDKLIMTSPRLA